MPTRSLKKIAAAVRNVPSSFNAPLPPATPIFGTVTAVQSFSTGAQTVSLKIGAAGGTAVGVGTLGSYSPVPGDSVVTQMINGVPLVQGSHKRTWNPT